MALKTYKNSPKKPSTQPKIHLNDFSKPQQLHQTHHLESTSKKYLLTSRALIHYPIYIIYIQSVRKHAKNIFVLLFNHKITYLRQWIFYDSNRWWCSIMIIKTNISFSTYWAYEDFSDENEKNILLVHAWVRVVLLVKIFQ